MGVVMYVAYFNGYLDYSTERLVAGQPIIENGHLSDQTAQTCFDMDTKLYRTDHVLGVQLYAGTFFYNYATGGDPESDAMVIMTAQEYGYSGHTFRGFVTGATATDAAAISTAVPEDYQQWLAWLHRAGSNIVYVPRTLQDARRAQDALRWEKQPVYRHCGPSSPRPAAPGPRDATMPGGAFGPGTR
ncbi:hypothetical protein DXV76_10285 [Rhodobacteraceae bacterium CCMM004]|nr:hypothetical protein DXV76_10285 [Rhodobacteraceae bacterium CCMM004]